MKIIDRVKHIFGIHKYGYVARLSPYSHIIACKICNKRFAMNTSLKVLIEWDLELEDFYTRMAKQYMKGGKVE